MNTPEKHNNETKPSSGLKTSSPAIVPETPPNLTECLTSNVSNIDDTSILCRSNSNNDTIDLNSQSTQFPIRRLDSSELSDQNQRVVKELYKAKLSKILKTFNSSQYITSIDLINDDNTIESKKTFSSENSCDALDERISNQNQSVKNEKKFIFSVNNNQTVKKPTVTFCDRSPDLFEGYDTDVETDYEAETTKTVFTHLPLTDTINQPQSDNWEKMLLKRLQGSLSGILPPPSKTIIQYSISELLDLYNENLQQKSIELNNDTDHCSLIKPTHKVEDVKDRNWQDITKDVKCHGLHYNRTVHSEDIELLYLKYIERCVGVETSSSFTCDYMSTNNPNRLKLLSKSPGARLSHLVGRRKLFNFKQNAFDSAKLGTKHLMIDVQKRGRKVRTPKRRTPAKRKGSGRKTPGSGGRKRAVLSYSTKPAISTRETSKRALFQSPPKAKPKMIIPEDVARRVDKSKRILFSPQSEHIKTDVERKNVINSTSQFNYGKRRRDEDGLLGNQSKMPRISDQNSINLTPRSILSKSQTFCAENSNEFKYNKTSVRSNSDATINCNQQLSQSHRQKLLWAVSTSLKKKNITSSHEKFTVYATVLAKVVKRLFLELIKRPFSTSDTMIRIADKQVFWVLQGKSVDEIYFNEKQRKENHKSVTQPKLIGYIAPEEYELLRNAKTKGNSTIFLSQSSMDSIGFSQSSFNFSMPSQSQTLSQYTDSLMTELSLSNNCFMDSRNVNENVETTTNNNALCNSSSKSNSGSVLRENVRECELRQKSGQKIIEFNGKNQKNISPYHDNKLAFVKRQISFDGI